MKLRRITMKLYMISTSCTSPSTAAMPLYRSKRRAMYTSIIAVASTTLRMALRTSVAPAVGPT